MCNAGFPSSLFELHPHEVQFAEQALEAVDGRKENSEF